MSKAHHNLNQAGKANQREAACALVSMRPRPTFSIDIRVGGKRPPANHLGGIAMPAQILVTLSAGIIMTLGLLHLAYTYLGDKLHPRDSDLLARLQTTSPVISRQTSMWKAWMGFNASHSLGAILFGAVFAYLALQQSMLLFHSYFLGVTGLVVLVAYLVMAKLYWFIRPLQGVSLALICYVVGFAVAALTPGAGPA
jgi:hypothetical protein